MKWSRIAHPKRAKIQQLTQIATKTQMKKRQDQTEVIILVYQGLQKVGLMLNLLPPPTKSYKTTITGDSTILRRP